MVHVLEHVLYKRCNGTEQNAPAIQMAMSLALVQERIMIEMDVLIILINQIPSENRTAIGE